MLLSGALFALFMMGFWLYCLTDAILTPAPECRGLPKPAWIAVIALTFIGGAIAWLIVREPPRNPSRGAVTGRQARWDPDAPGDLADPDSGYFRSQRWTAADDAVARHPAGRSRVAKTGQAAPKGPDDDPEFLRALDRAIRGNSAGLSHARAGAFSPRQSRSLQPTPE
jgi:hypothetical protein